MPPLPAEYNPATWMLEVCGGAAKMYVDSVQGADFHALYLASTLARSAAATANSVAAADAKAHPPLTMATRYATNRMQQVGVRFWGGRVESGTRERGRRAVGLPSSDSHLRAQYPLPLRSAN